MRIAFINGSPKTKNSASGSLLEDLKHYLSEKAEITEFGFHKPAVPQDVLEELNGADVWIFSFPLYVDGIPGHLLSCLVQLEEAQMSRRNITIYGIVNCGFYEGVQAELALKILQNWSVKAGFIWGSGVGVGGGGGLAQMPKMEPGHGPRAPIDKALASLADEILRRETRKNRYVSVAFPRFLYKLAAQAGWRQMIRANGRKIRDLGKKG